MTTSANHGILSPLSGSVWYAEGAWNLTFTWSIQ